MILETGGEHLNTENDSEVYKKIWLRFNCKGFSEGDQIQITHKQSDIYTEEAKIEICGDPSVWNNSMLTNGSLINATRTSSAEKDILPKTKNQTTAYTLTAQDAAKLNNSKCFIILGCGITIEKIILSSQKTLACNSIKNGWQGYDFNKSPGIPEIVSNDGFLMISGSTPSFDLGFIPMTVDSEGSRNEIVTNTTSFVKYRFYYIYNPATKKLNITRTCKVTYQTSNNRTVETINEITGANNYTISFDNDKMKFDSLPVTELSDIFYTDRYYSCPVPELKIDGTYTTVVNGHTCTLTIKSGYFVFVNPPYYYTQEQGLEFVSRDDTFENLTFEAYFGSVILDNNSIVLSSDYWKNNDQWCIVPEWFEQIYATYNQDSITFNSYNNTELNFVWTKQ